MKKKITLTTVILLTLLSLISVNVIFAEDEEIDLTDQVYQSEEIVREESNLDSTDEKEIIQNESFEVSGLDGEAYAVLTDEGDLIFFRSLNEYTNQSRQSVQDIKGNEYTGIVYSDIEKYASIDDLWYEQRSSIKRVMVAKDQTIKLISPVYWFMRCDNLSSFEAEGFDTSECDSLFSLFEACVSKY